MGQLHNINLPDYLVEAVNFIAAYNLTFPETVVMDALKAYIHKEPLGPVVLSELTKIEMRSLNHLIETQDALEEFKHESTH